mgnify:FL=1
MFAFVADNFFEVQKYMVLDGHIYTVMALMINGDVWEKLTAEDQEIVMQAAKDAGIVNIKGHRSVGGMRASIYNAMPMEGVVKLVQFMEQFEKENC